MYLTDGSPPLRDNLEDLKCSWLIQPSSSSPLDAAITGDREIVIDFQRVNLLNSKLTIYDASFADDNHVIWECDGCTSRPYSLSAYSGAMFVGFESHSEESNNNGGDVLILGDDTATDGGSEEEDDAVWLGQGTGFSAFYRSIIHNHDIDNDDNNNNNKQPLVLRMPNLEESEIAAADYRWVLPIFKDREGVINDFNNEQTLVMNTQQTSKCDGGSSEDRILSGETQVSKGSERWYKKLARWAVFVCRETNGRANE